MPSSSRARAKWVGALFSRELFGQGPVRIVALEDAVAVAIDTERHAVSRDHGPQSVEIAERVFWFELKVGGEDLAGGVVLKADEGEFGAAAFQPIMTAGIGEHHHAEAGTAQAASAVPARAALLRRCQLGARRMRRTVSRLTDRCSSLCSFWQR